MKIECYEHKIEVWSAKICEKLARHYRRDGLGTQCHIPGLLSRQFGRVYYNGGCVRGGKWYACENFPFPKLPEEFEIVYVLHWGYRLVKK